VNGGSDGGVICALCHPASCALPSARIRKKGATGKLIQVMVQTKGILLNSGNFNEWE